MYNQVAWDLANELEAFYAQPVPTVVPELPIVFRMSDWGTRVGCGTTACLAGSIQAMKAPKLFLRYLDGDVEAAPWKFAAKLLGLNGKQQADMFTPPNCPRFGLSDALCMLRHFAQTGDIVWE